MYKYYAYYYIFYNTIDINILQFFAVLVVCMMLLSTCTSKLVLKKEYFYMIIAKSWLDIVRSKPLRYQELDYSVTDPDPENAWRMRA